MPHVVTKVNSRWIKDLNIKRNEKKKKSCKCIGGKWRAFKKSCNEERLSKQHKNPQAIKGMINKLE